MSSFALELESLVDPPPDDESLKRWKSALADKNLRNELKERLRLTDGEEGEKLLNECVSICRIFNLSAEELQYKLEALNFRAAATHSEIKQYTMESLTVLKTRLQQSLADAAAAAARAMPAAKRRGPLGGVAGSGSGSANTPGGVGAGAAKSGPKLPKYMQHNASVFVNKGLAPGAPMVKVERDGSLVAVQGADAGDGAAGVNVNVRFSVAFKQLDGEMKERKYRYMYEKLTERSGVLDDRIEDFGEILRLHYGKKENQNLAFEVKEFGDPSSSVDEDIFVIGRVTQDYDTSSIAPSTKLTESTITLESSRLLSMGTRVPLVFQTPFHVRGGIRGAAGLGFFPGQIVALKGRNGGGGKFAAAEVVALPPLEASPAALGESSTADPLSSRLELEAGAPFSVAVAAGPYSADSDLEYAPWKALLAKFKGQKPTALILIGPFVDSNNTLIKSAKVNAIPVEIFRTKFIDPLRTFLDSNPGTLALLVSSVQDLLSDHIVYPQGPLSADLFPPDTRIRFLPNPAGFSLNGVTFGVTAVDVLFHLRKEELVKRAGEVQSIPPANPDDSGTDSMANLCRHFFQQRSFYPIFPPPVDLAHEVNLDASHLDALRLDAGHEGYAPDVLILPSRLKHFSKTVYYSAVINPSYAHRGLYSFIEVGPGSGGKSLRERLKVEVSKFGQ